MAAKKKRISWLDKEGGVAIDEYARRLKSFMKAMEDGIVTDAELKTQEKRVADIMRDVEPGLDAETHAKITALLCELTALDIMKTVHAMHKARPKTVFRG